MTIESTLTKFGYRFGRNGAHAARTMMSGELAILLAHQLETASKADYRQQVVDFNVLSKPTRKARELAGGDHAGHPGGWPAHQDGVIVLSGWRTRLGRC